MVDLSDPIAALRVSPARRLFGTGVQIALGLVLLIVAGQLREPSPVAIIVLLVLGLGSLWQATRFYRATARDLILTEEGVFDSAGVPIAEMTNIAQVDRGVFATKPSNGFSIRLKTARPRAWVPGLWWRIGTRVGVGGATSGKAARDMADIITIILKDPDVARRFDDMPDQDD